MESVCPKLSQQDAEELRANVNKVLRGSQPPYLILAEVQAIRELKGDKSRIVLTANKGVTMVVVDRQDYINKSINLLTLPAYKSITKDPTNKIKAKLITILRKIKKETGLDNNTYKYMYPRGCDVPKFYWLPKSHKPDIPLRPIMSSRGSVTYRVAKVLTKMLKPLVGRSPILHP